MYLYLRRLVSSREPPTRGGHGRVVSRSPCSGPLSAHSISLPPALSLQYTATLFIHYTGGLPLIPLPSIVFTYTLFVKSHSFILTTYPYHLSALRITHATAPQSIPTADSLVPNLPYVSSLLSLSHLDTPVNFIIYCIIIGSF